MAAVRERQHGGAQRLRRVLYGLPLERDAHGSDGRLPLFHFSILHGFDDESKSGDTGQSVPVLAVESLGRHDYQWLRSERALALPAKLELHDRTGVGEGSRD